MPRDNAGVIAPPPLIAASGLLLGLLLKALLPVQSLPEWFRFVGLAFMVVAMIPALWALLCMLRAGTHPEPSHPTTKLVTGGPFRWTRNPIYLSYTMFLIGVAFFTRNVWMLLTTAIVWVFLHYGVILREERYLERKFGASYVEYKQHVRRWL